MTKILVVEDEVEICRQIVDMLVYDGYEVLAAPDGQQAVNLAQQELPDLIISDIIMPDADGYGLFYSLKQDTNTANIPFIFLSALGQYEAVRQGMDLGADDYLVKPFDFAQLRKAVQARLQKHQSEEYLRFRQLAGQLIRNRDPERDAVATILQEQVLEAVNGLYLMQHVNIAEDGDKAELIWQTKLAEVIRSTQNVIYSLQPILLEQLSLAGLLQWLVLQHERNHGLEVTLALPAMDANEFASAL